MNIFSPMDFMGNMTLQVYLRIDGSDVFIQEILDLRHAQVHKREAAVGSMAFASDFKDMLFQQTARCYHIPWVVFYRYIALKSMIYIY